MDTSRDNYSKWSQKEKGQISYDITYMWNLKKMAQWTFLQNRNRFTNFEIKLMVTKGKPWINQRMGFPHSSVGKESACSAGDSGLILGLGRSTGEGIGYSLQYFGASLVAQLVKNLPAMWETWAQSLGWEDHGECKMVGNIMWNARPDEAQAGIKISRRNINNLRYADDTTFMSESKEGLKSLWWKWKRRVKKLA